MPEVSAIAKVRQKLEDKFKSSAELFPEVGVIKKIGVWPTSSAIINAVTGVGGIPRGRLTEIVGGFSSGKTTTILETIAVMQRLEKNATCLFLDFEHALDLSYAKKLGVNLAPDRFIFSQPDHFQQGDEIIDSFVSADLVDMIVVDSAAAMTPQEALEGKADQSQRIGLQAALMERMLARLTKKINKGRKPALVLLNQTRANINLADPRAAAREQEKPAGGSAIKFYASMRLRLEILAGEGDSNRDTKSATDQVYTANKTRVVCFKNKVAPPQGRGTFSIDYGKGINNVLSVADLAEQKLGVMSGAGFINYKGDTPETTVSGRLGREGWQQHVRENPKLLSELERKVVAAIMQEQAETLGLTALTQGGQAKEVRDDDDVVLTASSTEVGGMPVEAKK